MLKVEEGRESSLSSRQKYLSEIPESDIVTFSRTYAVNAKQIRQKAEALSLWCDTKGKRMRNYRAFLQNSLLKDFGKREADVLDY